MKIVIHNDETNEMLQIINRRHPDVEIFCCNKSADLPKLIKETQSEAIFSVHFSYETYPRTEIVTAESLRWISVGGVGTDHLGKWDAGRITVTNTAGAGAVSIAQYVFAGLLSFAFKLPRFADDKQHKRWRPEASVSPINGKTMLIIGLGATGTEVARLARCFDMKTLGVRARPRKTNNVDEVYASSELPNLWPRADFVVVCVPLLPSTRGLVSRAAFELMQASTIVIDVSRGGVVDQDALLDALDNEIIAGAVRDVFEPEPLKAEHPLWNVKNLIMTPHCCSVYDGWNKKAIDMFCDNLQRYKNGETLSNIVDPGKGY